MNYDKYPETRIVGHDGEAWEGLEEVAAELGRLALQRDHVLVVECYPGVANEVFELASEAFDPDCVIISDEIFYDGETETYYIIWSSTDPGKLSPVEKGTSEGALDHRVYFTKTKDFKTFEPTKLYFDPGHNTIDAFLAKKDGKYSLFYKDETLYPEAKKIILEAQGPTPEGPFAEGKRISAQDWVEGPGALRIGNDWIVYYDCYRD